MKGKRMRERMKKRQIIQTRDAVILVGMLCLALLIGSLWDEPISRRLYSSESAFGGFLAAYGELPIGICMITAGVLFIMGRKREQQGAVHMAVGAACILYGAFAMAIMPRGGLSLSTVASSLISVVLTALIILADIKLFRNADREAMLKVAALFVLCIIAQGLVIDVLKALWVRPRMKMILETPEAHFVPWWVVSHAMRDKLAMAGVDKAWFTSFPSGHTANAASAMLLALLPLIRPEWKRKQSLLLFLGAAWALAVALSRIILGMHFVTDTIVGFAVTLGVMLLFVKLVFQNSFSK